MESLTFEIKYREARHLPIVTAFAKKLGIIEEVDRLIDGQMEISPGRVVLGLILDTLSGRTPLFRLYEFFAHHDIELLLGQDIPAKKFSDDNVGRVLDRIFAVGTQQILGAISLNAVKMFDLELKAVHFDTTSPICPGRHDRARGRQNRSTSTRGWVLCVAHLSPGGDPQRCGGPQTL